MSRQYQFTNSAELQNLESLIHAKMATINTSLPATVVSVDGNLVTVKPQIPLFYIDANNTIQSAGQMAQIPDLPVFFVGTSSNNSKFPINPGDSGVVVFFQGDTDPIYRSGNAGTRRFDLLDGWFIPTVQGPASGGTVVTAQNYTVNATDYKLNSTTMELTTTGESKINASDLKVKVQTGFDVTNIISTSLLTTLIAVLNAIQSGVMLSGDTWNPATISAIAAQVTLLTSFLPVEKKDE